MTSDLHRSGGHELSTWEEACEFRKALEEQGRRLVFTNGCFDLLHAGHVRYLRQARALGDALCVALNADASVRALKGPDRPVNSVEDRAEVLLALRSVDMVVTFEEPRATRVLQSIRPHCYAKGGDYTLESLDPEERAALKEAGTEIHLVELVPGRSTTSTLRRLRAGEQQKQYRLGVLGSGYGSTLESLLAAVGDGRLPDASVAVVISDVADARILDVARESDVEAIHVHPGPYRNRLGLRAQEKIRDHLLRAEVDLVVLAGFMRRLKAPILQAFPGRIVNIHPSLLPRFPGRAAWRQALEAGVAQTGTTVHLVDEGIDSGRILAQEPVEITDEDTEDTLRERIQAAERRLYPRVIAEYLTQTSSKHRDGGERSLI